MRGSGGRLASALQLCAPSEASCEGTSAARCFSSMRRNLSRAFLPLSGFCLGSRCDTVSISRATSTVRRSRKTRKSASSASSRLPRWMASRAAVKSSAEHEEMIRRRGRILRSSGIPAWRPAAPAASFRSSRNKVGKTTDRPSPTRMMVAAWSASSTPTRWPTAPMATTSVSGADRRFAAPSRSHSRRARPPKSIVETSLMAPHSAMRTSASRMVCGDSAELP